MPTRARPLEAQRGPARAPSMEKDRWGPAALGAYGPLRWNGPEKAKPLEGARGSLATGGGREEHAAGGGPTCQKGARYGPAAVAGLRGPAAGGACGARPLEGTCGALLLEGACGCLTSLRRRAQSLPECTSDEAGPECCPCAPLPSMALLSAPSVRL